MVSVLNARSVYAAIRFVGLNAAVRRFRAAVPVLCYHNVVAGPLAPGTGDGGLHLPLARFGEQMEWLRRHYRVISLAELLASSDRGFPRGTAVLTFDDAYQGTFQHALPLLESLGLPATIFVVGAAPAAQNGFWWDHPDVVRQRTPGLQSRWLNALQGDGDRIRGELAAPPAHPEPSLRAASWDTIRAGVRRGLVAIGVHSMTHRALPALDPQALKHELLASREVAARELGVTPTVFAYPYGAWNPTVRDAARDAGYLAALTLDPRPVRRGDDPWALPRINVPAGISLSALGAWSAGLRLRRA